MGEQVREARHSTVETEPPAGERAVVELAPQELAAHSRGVTEPAAVEQLERSILGRLAVEVRQADVAALEPAARAAWAGTADAEPAAVRSRPVLAASAPLANHPMLKAVATSVVAVPAAPLRHSTLRCWCH